MCRCNKQYIIIKNVKKSFLCNMDDSVIELNDETFKNCSLKLAFRKMKNFEYNDVELTNASLDYVAYHYEYNILYIYKFIYLYTR